MRYTLLTAASLLAAVCCQAQAQSPSPNQTAEWFLAHPDRIAAQQEWCDEHPTQRNEQLRSGDRTCINVVEARISLMERETRRANNGLVR